MAVLRFSVVIPTYNRGASLEACLAALANQDAPRDSYEVIVVDDGSRTPPRDLIARYAKTMQVRLIEQANAGPAAARNAGAFAASAPYLAFTDDDCRPSPGWLRLLGDALDRHPRAAIGGAVVTALHNQFSTSSQLLVDFLYDYFATHNRDGQFFITANVALPRDLFRELGGFDLTFPFAAAEDRDLCERWTESGFELAFAPDAIIWHAHPLTLKSFWRQHFTYGRGAWCLNKAKNRRGRQGLTVPPFAFYSSLLLYPLSKASFPRNLGLVSLAALSQLAYVIGFAWQSRHDSTSKNLAAVTGAARSNAPH